MNLFNGFMFNFFIQTILGAIGAKLGMYSEFNILNVFVGTILTTVFLLMIGYYDN